MNYVNVVYSTTGPLASIQIQAGAFCALPSAYRLELGAILKPYIIPMPGLQNQFSAPVDPNGPPLCALVAAQVAAPLGVRAEALIQRVLTGQ